MKDVLEWIKSKSMGDLLLLLLFALGLMSLLAMTLNNAGYLVSFLLGFELGSNFKITRSLSEWLSKR